MSETTYRPIDENAPVTDTASAPSTAYINE